MESKADMIHRVRLMADGEDTWDLSDNDIAALQHVLDQLATSDAALRQALAALEEMDSLVREWVGAAEDATHELAGHDEIRYEREAFSAYDNKRNAAIAAIREVVG